MDGRDERSAYLAVFNAMERPVLVVDAQMAIQDGNPALESYFGVSIDAIRGRICSSVFKCTECIGCPVHMAVVDGQVFPRREFNIKVRGEERTVVMNVSRLRAGDGNGGGAIAIIQDISEEKQFRQDLMLLSQVTEQVADSLMVANNHFEIMYVNRAFTTMFGFEPEELRGRTPEFLNGDAEADAIQASIEESLNGGNPWRGEFTNRRKDGTTFMCDVMIVPLRNDEGDVFALCASYRDVTERERFSEEMQRIEKLESIGILAGGIAHDLNNMLTSVMGNLSLAKLEEDPLVRNRWIEDAEKSSDQLRRLTLQLLTFAKGGLPVTKATVITDLLRESAEFALRGANVRVEFDLERSPMQVDADPGQLNQVFHNLLINAAQAMPDGGVVHLRESNITLPEESMLPLPAGRYVQIAVRDEGAGIPPDIIGRIFDPFFTTKQEGSGLGLATAYSIVQKHGGHLTVESNPGKGATFLVYLPAAHTTVSPKAATGGGAPKRGHGRILLMEDEDRLRRLASRMLTMLGYEVEVAVDGTEALAKYRAALAANSPFDLVIADLIIAGGMGGEEAVTRLRELTPNLKAIVSSGYATDSALARYREHGFDDILPKPYGIKELGDVVQRVLRS